MQFSQRPFGSLVSRKAVLPMIVLAIGSVALAGRSMFSSPTTTTSAPFSSLPHESLIQPPASAAQSSQVTTTLITIRPTGFEPSEIRLAGGQFRIAVDNKSGLDEVKLRLMREGGARMRELRLSPEQHKWREKIVLPPGSYLLTAVGYPNWLCRITVTP